MYIEKFAHREYFHVHPCPCSSIWMWTTQKLLFIMSKRQKKGKFKHQILRVFAHHDVLNAACLEGNKQTFAKTCLYMILHWEWDFTGKLPNLPVYWHELHRKSNKSTLVNHCTMCPDRDFWVYFKFYPHLNYNEPILDPILCKQSWEIR